MTSKCGFEFGMQKQRKGKFGYWVCESVLHNYQSLVASRPLMRTSAKRKGKARGVQSEGG